jgi:tRNA-modifying protein YgfZ
MSQHSTAYQAGRHGAGIIDRSARGRILVSGNDRASYLHGLLTNDITALRAGGGCYAAYLTAQGRMISDLWVYELGDVILLTLSGDVRETVLAKLDQFVFSEDVQLGDVTTSFAQVAVVGPAAARIVGGVVSAAPESVLQALVEHGNVRVSRDGAPVIVTRISDAGAPGFDLYVERDRAAALLDALRAAGAVDIDPATAETLRIEAGIPLFHRDMDEQTIPLEAGIESRAISLTKGCYVGQEVIIRVLHRGHGRVARKLVGLRMDGDVAPLAGASVRSGDRDAGEVTSATLSPALERPIALAYVHRDFTAPGTAVAIEGTSAEVVTLPFTASPA